MFEAPAAGPERPQEHHILHWEILACLSDLSLLVIACYCKLRALKRNTLIKRLTPLPDGALPGAGRCPATSSWHEQTWLWPSCAACSPQAHRGGRIYNPHQPCKSPCGQNHMVCTTRNNVLLTPMMATPMSRAWPGRDYLRDATHAPASCVPHAARCCQGRIWNATERAEGAPPHIPCLLCCNPILHPSYQCKHQGQAGRIAW